jgi:hypothetical protein
MAPKLKRVRMTGSGTAEDETAPQLLCMLLEVREQVLLQHLKA